MTKHKITPIGARVAVKPIQEEEKSISGIILPESANQEKTQLGIVESVGDLKDVKISIGDKLLFSEYGYDSVEVEGEEYYIVKEDKMLAVIK